MTFKLENMTKFVRMLNNGSDVLDEVLQVGKVARDLRGIGFNYQSLNKQGETLVTNFIPPKRKLEPMMSNQLSQHHARHQNTQTGGKLLRLRCHYYGNFGYIKPLYFKLYGYPRRPTQPMANEVVIKTRKE